MKTKNSSHILNKSFSLLFPIYNEGKIIEKNTKRLYFYLKGYGFKKFEILLCDNASTDNTNAIAKNLSKKYPEIKYFFTNKKGIGSGVKLGIKTAKLFSFIKAQAKISDPKDGRPFADIPFQGVKTLIRFFEKANLLSTEQIEDFKNYKNANPDSTTAKKPRTQREKKLVTSRPMQSQISENSHGHLSLSGIEIELNSIKNTKFAIMQLEDLLKEIETETDTANDESLETTNTNTENQPEF